MLCLIRVNCISIVIPTLQIRELRFREVKWLAQGDLARKLLDWDPAQIFQNQVLSSLYCAAFEYLHDLRRTWAAWAKRNLGFPVAQMVQNLPAM